MGKRTGNKDDAPTTLKTRYKANEEAIKSNLMSEGQQQHLQPAPLSSEAAQSLATTSPSSSPLAAADHFLCAVVFASHAHKDYLPGINEEITQFNGHTLIGKGFGAKGLLRTQLQYGLEQDSDDDVHSNNKQHDEVVLKVGVVSDVFYRDQIQRHNGLSLLAADLPYPSTVDQLCSSQKAALLVQCVEHIVYNVCKVPLKSDVEIFPYHETSERLRCWQVAKDIGSLSPIGIVKAFLTSGSVKAMTGSAFRSTLITVDVRPIFEYLGAESMYYYAWMNHYQRWLVGSSLVGTSLWVWNLATGMTNDSNPVVPFFSVFMMIWSVMFVKMWVRRAEFIALEFNLNSHEGGSGGAGGTAPLDPSGHGGGKVRARYHGSMRRSPITGESELHYPGWKRFLKQPLSWVFTLTFLAGSIFVQVCSLNLQGYMNSDQHAALEIRLFDQFSDPGAIFDPNSNLALIPVVLHSVFVLVLNMAFKHMAESLTTWENYRTEEEHEEALTLKRVFFEFVDCFAALFYVAFYRLDLPLLRTELCSLYMVDQIRRVVLESLIPFAANYRTKAVRHISRKKSELIKKASSRLLKSSDGLSSTDSQPSLGPSNSSATFESRMRIPMSAPDEVMGEYESFDDYLETTMQFGYVTMFAAAFPLASVLSLVSNIIEVRSDLFKQVFVVRRPIPRRARSIGIWTTVLRAFAFMSVISNTLLFAFTSDQMRHFFPFLYDVKTGEIESGDGRFVVSIAFAIEHVLLAVVAIIYWRIPSVPKKVYEEVQRRIFMRAKAREKHIAGVKED